jgi:TM2 domain-containing membrane protein YozV
MESNKVDMFLISNGKFFESHHIGFVREKLMQADDSKWNILQTLDFKDPTMILIVSLIVGGLGVDRFLIGDTGLGVLKLVTCGGFGIWAIVDWFLIMGATKEKNIEKFQRHLY